jgi:hypothetical protein
MVVSCMILKGQFALYVASWYCNEIAQSVAKQRLGKQTTTEGLFSVRSAPQPLLRNAEVNTSLQQLVDTQQ